MAIPTFKKLTQQQMDDALVRMEEVLGEYEADYLDQIVKPELESTNRNLQFKFPNTYNADDYLVLLTEKTAYRINQIDEMLSNIIIQEETMLLTLENEYY